MELTTTLRFEGVTADMASLVAEKLEDAFLEVFKEHAVNITQYFVRPVAATVQVGFRFSAIDPDNAEEAANFILEKALEKANELSAVSNLDPKRVTTSLVGV